MRLFSLLLLAILCLSCHRPSSKKFPLVIVLGIDGMDPVFVEKHWNDLPNVRALARRGEFKRLQTTMPPQSPVAWSTFSTGLDPGQHGIFDFVYRDPHTITPFSAMDLKYRHGEVFWKKLSDSGVPVKILRMPVNYPPVKTKGDSLAGMGVPDMLGTFGIYTFFTDANSQMKDDRAQLRIEGPANPYLHGHPPTSVTLTVDVDPFENAARFHLQDRYFILRAGEWSDWIPISFPVIPHLQSAQGMIRVYAKSFRPDFQVYVSPVNFNPLHPEAEISAPASYSAQLAGKIGLFYTQGMAEDTLAYRHGVFNREEYLTQARFVADDEIRMLKQGLEGFQQGFLFLHFSGVDQNSHMLWGKFDDELLQTYKLVDETLGWVMRNKPQATLIVMSDHGFSSFDRAVNLNAALSNSPAYALGLNAIYLKLAGRERDGTVPISAAPQTLRAIGEKLLALRDPQSGHQVIVRVWSPHPNFQGNIEYIPDLIVGFEPGYRTSWDSSLGENKGPMFADNNDAWIGDHCIAPEFVPGVLISNAKITAPSLKDLTESILQLYGVKLVRANIETK